MTRLTTILPPAGLLVLLSAGVALAAEVPVATPQQLIAALAAARGGETLVLRAGNYDALTLTKKTVPNVLTSQIRLKSADPANPAVFTRLKIEAVAQIAIDGVKFDYDAPPGTKITDIPNRISGSSNIEIVNSVFDGDLAEGVSPTQDGFGAGRGLVVGGSSDIMIAKNLFFNWFTGAGYSDTANLTIDDNEMYDISGDVMDFANVDNVTISNNYIHDVKRSPRSKTHSDMIQFWTTNTTSPSTNVRIINNFFDSGLGGFTQTIFMRNERVDRGLAGRELYYQNVHIEGNVIRNWHTHAITVGEADGVTIIDNTIVQQRSTEDGGGKVSIPSINVNKNALRVKIQRNVTPRLRAAEGAPSSWIIDSNEIVQRDEPALPNYYGNVFVDALVRGRASLANLRLLPTSRVAKGGVGARKSRFNERPRIIDGFILSQVRGDRGLIQEFDASNVYDSGGKRDMTAAAVTWDFGDGSTGTGINLRHRYSAAGTYKVEALIRFVNGENATLRRTIIVPGP